VGCWWVGRASKTERKIGLPVDMQGFKGERERGVGEKSRPCALRIPSLAGPIAISHQVFPFPYSYCSLR
jgi:hypothetical protein